MPTDLELLLFFLPNTISTEHYLHFKKMNRTGSLQYEYRRGFVTVKCDITRLLFAILDYFFIVGTGAIL